MKLFNLLCIKISFLLLVLIFSDPGHAEKDWNQYIPVMGQIIHADIMEIQSSGELEKLAEKLQEGLKKNPEWALEYMKSAPKGHPLPYHENLGLTKQEYTKMMKLSQTEGSLSLKKSETLDITFEALKDGRIKIVTNKDSALNNVILSEKEAETSFGNLTDVSDINNQNPNAITGPWKGIKWSKNTFDEQTMSGETIQFCIGKLTESKNKGIIYYDGKILKGSGTLPMQFTHILFFPLAK